MNRWMLKLVFLSFGFVLAFTGCSNSKNYETRSQCMDRCVREQFVCALALAPQLDNATATTVTCVTMYMMCYEKCPVVSTSSSTTTRSSRSSSSSSSSGNKGGSSSSSGSGSGSSSSGGSN
ncbi:hypothetical protein JWG41_08085 [Leptospira sp. 201903075]|uniref:hypothetical protein n=1 Tax=Leptospira chreensis TaxID=2810035 RepID=UPI00196490B0|nr:hypothetical protein [Leptospira chreensis]MBM9590400.1 hypothetical protein [Leptospira chreensis]